MPQKSLTAMPSLALAELAALAIIMIFAVLLFLGFGGATILPVQNIGWLKGGDPAQHLLGWLFYRDTDLLQWPIGANPEFGELTAGSVVFSDSLPLFAVVFRLLDPVLPDMFQYFGLWILTCFVLQGVFGYWLLRLLSASVGAAAAGACLLLASPYMLWRLHGHEALIGHWILLASLCLYLRVHMMWWAWGALLIVAVAVHAYLAAMVGGVWAARLWLERGTPAATVLRAATTFAAAAAAAWALGYFMIPGASSGKPGFGQYRTTLASWIDPDGMWGLLLPDLSNGPGGGTYEGFAYLGLGALAVVLLTGAGLALRRYRPVATARPVPHAPLGPLIAMCIAYTLFALSDHISAFGVLLMQIYVPDDLPGISTFRASGRFIWLPSYVLVAFAIAWVARSLSRRAALPVLAVAALVQVADMKQAMQFFRDRFAAPAERQFTAPFWDAAGARYDRIAAWPVDPHSGPVIEASFVAARHGMTVDQAYLARADGDAFTRMRAATRSELGNGTLRDDTLYLLHDPGAAEFMATRIADLELDVFLAAVDGVWAIAPGWTGCRDACGATTPPRIPPPVLPPDGVLTLAEGGNFATFSRWGWSGGETTGRWTDGPLATLSVDLGDRATQDLRVRMEAQPYLGGSMSEQQVRIFGNGRLLHAETLQRNETMLEFDIPPGTIGADGRLDLDLRVPDATSPSSLGLSDDSRELGMYVSTITIRSAGG